MQVTLVKVVFIIKNILLKNNKRALMSFKYEGSIIRPQAFGRLRPKFCSHGV